MRTTREIPLKSLESASRTMLPMGTVDVTIEIVGEDVGDQVEVRRLPWHSLIYDPSADVLEVSVGGRSTSVPVIFRHLVHHPTTVWVEEDAGRVLAMAIESTEETRTLIQFHTRPELDCSGEEPAGLAVS